MENAYIHQYDWVMIPIIISGLASSIAIPLGMRRFQVKSKRNISQIWPVISCLSVNILIFPVNFLVMGQIGAGIGVDIARISGIDPIITITIGILLSIGSMCAVVSALVVGVFLLISRNIDNSRNGATGYGVDP